MTHFHNKNTKFNQRILRLSSNDFLSEYKYQNNLTADLSEPYHPHSSTSIVCFAPFKFWNFSTKLKNGKRSHLWLDLWILNLLLLKRVTPKFIWYLLLEALFITQSVQLFNTMYFLNTFYFEALFVRGSFLSLYLIILIESI